MLWAPRPAFRPLMRRNSNTLPTAPASCCRSHSATCVVASQGGGVDRTAALRRLLASPGLLVGPCCHDALSARLIERAGFPYTFMSGFTTSAARLAAPDAQLLTLSEMLDTGRGVHEATSHIPVIGDGDTGYGNAINAQRAVSAYANTGFAGILLEDQVAPKSCGHVKGKRVVSRQEAVMKIRAAVDARNAGKDVCILARTDAKQAESIDEALWRVAAFADEGADMLFIDALASKEEMRRFCQLDGPVRDVPKLVNMLEGGGKTPILTLEELEELGFRLAAYPLSLLGVSIRAMEEALQGLKQGKVPPPKSMPTFLEIQELVGFPEYFEKSERYAEKNYVAREDREVLEGGTSPNLNLDTPQSRNGVSGLEVVEADEIITPEETKEGPGNREVPAATSGRVLDVDDPQLEVDGDRQAGTSQPVKPRSVRVSVRQRESGEIEFETRLPTNFLGGLSSILPNVNNLESMVKAALGDDWDPKKPVISIPSDGKQIEVFFE